MRGWNCGVRLYLLPGTCLTGLLLNVISVVGFTIALRRGFSLYFPLLHFLIALSFFDAIQLILTGIIMGTEQWVRAYPSLSSSHIYLSFIGYPLMMTANYASIWSITAICLQRFLAICYPFHSRRWGVQNHDVCTILAITTIALALNVVRYWEHNLSYNVVNGTVSEVFLIEGPLYRKPLYFILMSLSYVTFVYLIPLILLAVLNGCMLIVIYRSQRLNERVSNNERRERKSMMMILTVIVMFFGCHSLAMAIRLVRFSGITKDFESTDLGKFLSDISNLLVSLSSSTNPLIYFFFTSRFRHVLFKASVVYTAEEHSLLNMGRGIGSRGRLVSVSNPQRTRERSIVPPHCTHTNYTSCTHQHHTTRSVTIEALNLLAPHTACHSRHTSPLSLSPAQTVEPEPGGNWNVEWEVLETGGGSGWWVEMERLERGEEPKKALIHLPSSGPGDKFVCQVTVSRVD